MVDVFAGPGGLGEGFAALVEEGHAPFRIGISVENEAAAHRALTLIEGALRFAVAVAGLCVKGKGAQQSMPSRAVVQKLLSQQRVA